MGSVALNRKVQFETMRCGECGIVFALEDWLMAKWVEEKHGFYCPNGHSRRFVGETEAERLAKQLETAKRDAEWQRQRAESADKRLIAAKGQMTKLKKRVNCGVCPHCQRTVSQMARHIATKHPEALADASKSVDAVARPVGGTTE